MTEIKIKTRVEMRYKFFDELLFAVVVLTLLVVEAAAFALLLHEPVLPVAVVPDMDVVVSCCTDVKLFAVVVTTELSAVVFCVILRTELPTGVAVTVEEVVESCVLMCIAAPNEPVLVYCCHVPVLRVAVVPDMDAAVSCCTGVKLFAAVVTKGAELSADVFCVVLRTELPTGVAVAVEEVVEVTPETPDRRILIGE
ncbi:hypothetical protein QR680_014642 [Steinernema hermaphroditum]|uniref:Uncharacterized protein n=1 Tax=Steinernema hermaphroditum TaxID=289476 RepID=A0AA39IC84_9BILA|nr:hypothetical protein QR680_014642 [Steinernema hermaphroditum]